MKRMITIAVCTALSASLYAFANDGGGGATTGCSEMMKNGQMGMMGGGHGGMMSGEGNGMMGGEGKGMMGGMGSAEMRKRCAEMMATSNEASQSSNGSAASGGIHGTGVVRHIDEAGGKVTLQHAPIPAIGWPAMTMTFAVSDPKAMAGLAPGQNVSFDLAKRGTDYVVTSIH